MNDSFKIKRTLYRLPDGTMTDDEELLGKQWEKCQLFMQRIFPEHVITSIIPGFRMVALRKNRFGENIAENAMEFTTETYLHLLKNKDEIAKRLLEDLP